ncbi:MAG: Ig-like domain-containing protein [Candidatus Kapabacteria bacterium]|nr:Ig-like domain-containing protein [Candidatus Kapabacteria bacterium]
MKTFIILVLSLCISIEIFANQENIRIDLSYATISSTDYDIGNPRNCFDGDTLTLMRSFNINPAYVILVFDESVSVDSAAILCGQLGQHDGDQNLSWLEAADNINDLTVKSGTYILAVDSGYRAGGFWHGKACTSKISRKIWKFTVKKVVGDNYVHLWELGLYSYDIPATTSYKLDMLTELQANNFVINNSANLPAKEVFDKNSNSGICFENQPASHFLISNKTNHTINKMKFLIQQQCTWYVAYANTYSDLQNHTNSYKSTEPVQNSINQWITVDFEANNTAKHFKIVTSNQPSNLCLKEVELFSDTPMNKLIGLQNQLELWVGWTWKNVQDFLLYKGTQKISKNSCRWTSSNPEVATVDNKGLIKALKAGTATISAEFQDGICTTELTVTASGRQMEKGIPTQFIATPADNCVYEVPFVIINFIPSTDGVNKNAAYAMEYLDIQDRPLSEINQKHITTVERLKFALEEGSRFRKYKNPNARPSIGVKVVEYITIYEPLPPSIENPCYDRGILEYAFDFEQIFDRINLKDLVENKGVRYVWFLVNGGNAYLPGYDADFVKPENFRAGFESYMSTPTGIQACNGNNPEPLPVYNKTYTVINSSMCQSVFNMLNFEPFTHQFEHLWIAQNQIQDGNIVLLWDKFVGKIGRCGWTHTPPNTEINYGYYHYIQADTNKVKPKMADIEDWKPDNSGEKKLISYHVWEDIQYNWPDGINQFEGREELQWFIYWLQSIPGYNNKIPYNYNGKEYVMSNFWKFVYDWDYYSHNETGLYEPKIQPLLQITNSPDNLCTGAEFELSFSVEGEFESSNIFTAELSDKNGNFQNSVVIGTTNGTKSGIILCKLPVDCTNGSNYKLRIIATKPSVSCILQDKFLNIYKVPQPQITGTNAACKFTSNTYLRNAEEQNKYKWFVKGGIINGCDTCKTVEVVWNEEAANVGELILDAENSTLCKESDTLKVDLLTLPQPEITGLKEVCTGEYLTLTSKYFSGFEFKWIAQDGINDGSDFSQNFRVKWNNPGKYNVRLVNSVISSGCKDSTEIEVTVNETPVQPVITKYDDKLVSSADAGNQWYLDNQKLQDSVNKILYPNLSGIYKVMSISGNCESDYSEPVNYQITGVNDHQTPNSGLITYNPIERTITTLNGNVYSLMIFNLNGGLINKFGSLEINATIDLSSYPVGVYFIIVNDKFLKIMIY